MGEKKREKCLVCCVLYKDSGACILQLITWIITLPQSRMFLIKKKMQKNKIRCQIASLNKKMV